jgi:predicted phosphodiesterase
VLSDARASGVDTIACLGDVATLGPRPRQVLALVREACAHFILGNHDEYMFAPEHLARHTSAPVVIDAVDWCRARLEPDDLAFIRSFAPRADLSLANGNSLLLFHGSPASNDRDLLVDTKESELDELFAGEHALVMAGGHTHIQMLRQHRGVLLVNPGSVGMPFERYVEGAPPTVMPYAEYAIVEVSGGNLAVSLRRVALDRDALFEAARSWETSLGAYLAAQYQRSAG